MSPYKTRPRKARGLAFAAALCSSLIVASMLPLTLASCRSRQARAGEPAAYERLRLLTRGGALPPEQQVAQLASEFSGTRTGALAQLVRARIRYEARDYAGAAALLRSEDFKDETRVGDYALWLRGDALDKAGRRAESRAAFEELVRDYPDSLRARAAALRSAQFLMQDNQPAAVPAELAKLAGADDSDALLLTAKAYEQTGDQLKALAAYRRLYFYAPTSAQNDAEAAAALPRLNSSGAPANAAEAAARAEGLFRAKRYAEALAAYNDNAGRFPETATTAALLRRGVAASNARNRSEERGVGKEGRS